MQLEYSHEIGTDYATVKLSDTNFKHNVANSLGLFYEAIGGKYNLSTNTWTFPLFVSILIITQIIHNTCFMCGGLMEDGQALDNTWVGSEDFGGDYGQPGTTTSKIGQPVMKKVRKCTSCGHSHT